MRNPEAKKRANRKWLLSHRDEKRKLDKIQKRKHRDRGRKFLYEYLLSHPCVDCGESDPLVLEFHHLRDKKRNIGNLKSASLSAIQKEISKCIVLCANCHKRRTAKEQKWYKLLQKTKEIGD